MIWFGYNSLMNRMRKKNFSEDARRREMEARSVKKIIDEWDPIDLLAHAPEDEYLSEVNVITELVKASQDLEFIADGIYSVFDQAFKGVFSKTKDECREIAKMILMDSDHWNSTGQNP